MHLMKLTVTFLIKMLNKLALEISGLHMRRAIRTKSRASNMLNSEMLPTGVARPKLRHGWQHLLLLFYSRTLVLEVFGKANRRKKEILKQQKKLFSHDVIFFETGSSYVALAGL